MTVHRPRTSTFVLLGFFVVTLVVYFAVRPVPAAVLRRPAAPRATPSPHPTATRPPTPSRTPVAPPPQRTAPATPTPTPTPTATVPSVSPTPGLPAPTGSSHPPLVPAPSG